MENFVVRYKTEGHSKIQLPEGFLDIWDKTLQNPLKIKTSNGITLDVEFASIRGEVWFTDSWNQVANELNLSQNDVVVFSYDGFSTFNVIFLDNCFMEKKPADSPIVPFPVKFATVLHDRSYRFKLMLHVNFWETTNGILENPLVISLDDGTTFLVKWVKKRFTIGLYDGWAQVADTCNLSLHDFLVFEMRSSSKLSLKVIRMSARNIVNTRRELPVGMTIGVIEQSVGVGDSISGEVDNDGNHLTFFRAVDYMVVIQNTADDKFIKLPTGFSKEWGSTLKNPLVISTCDGIDRIVEYGTHRGEIWLTKGWSKVANDFNLGCSDVLLFKYNGKSFFQLMCFDTKCVEKTLPPKSAGKLPVHFYTTFKWDCYRKKLMMPHRISKKFCRDMKNPITIMVDDGSSWRVKWIMVGEDIWFHHGWQEVALHCRLKYDDFLFMVMTNNSEMGLRIVRRDVHRVTIARNQIRGVFCI